MSKNFCRLGACVGNWPAWDLPTTRTTPMRYGNGADVYGGCGAIRSAIWRRRT